MKTITLITAAAFGLVSATAAFAEGKNPAQAISQNLDKNGAFSSINGGPSVKSDNVRFGDGGAMRSLNGKAYGNAAQNSAVDGVDVPGQGRHGGTRVEPRACRIHLNS